MAAAEAARPKSSKLQPELAGPSSPQTATHRSGRAAGPGVATFGGVLGARPRGGTASQRSSKAGWFGSPSARINAMSKGSAGRTCRPFTKTSGVPWMSNPMA